MDAAQHALDEAVARQQQIAALLVQARAAVELDEKQHQGVKGRPTKERAAHSARLKAAVARLESGLLPGEFRPAVPVPAGSLAASARANAQHHAEAAPLPAGRPACAAGSSGSSGSSGGGGATRAAISSHRDRSQHAARSIRID